MNDKQPKSKTQLTWTEDDIRRLAYLIRRHGLMGGAPEAVRLALAIAAGDAPEAAAPGVVEALGFQLLTVHGWEPGDVEALLSDAADIAKRNTPRGQTVSLFGRGK